MEAIQSAFSSKSPIVDSKKSPVLRYKDKFSSARLDFVEDFPIERSVFYFVRQGMLPIIYQLLEHSTCSGRVELMLRCEKGQFSQYNEQELQQLLAGGLQIEHDRLELDTLRDHTADRLYLFCQSDAIQQLLLQLFHYCKQNQLQQFIHALYIAHEECEHPDIQEFLHYLTEDGREYWVL